MPSIKDIRKRIASVKSTQQTTKAMKMVSAAKLRRAQEAIQNQRPYAHAVGALIKRISALPGVPIESPLIQREGVGNDGTKKKVLLVLVTSDRGLCGGFNSNIIKTAQRWMVKNHDRYESIQLAFVGRKAYDFFKTKKVLLGTHYSELGGKVTFAKARTLANKLCELYLSGQVDEVRFIYNEFKNIMSQKVVVESYLPLREAGAGDDSSDDASVVGDETEATATYVIKPSPAEVLRELVNKHFAIQSFRVLLESQAGEHGARMSSMDNATKNAGEMIRLLTLQYNKARQAGITKELLEIIGGSESQKAS
jgi:F-type H+-transporting ATPase subunit gamma